MTSNAWMNFAELFHNLGLAELLDLLDCYHFFNLGLAELFDFLGVGRLFGHIRHFVLPSIQTLLKWSAPVFV